MAIDPDLEPIHQQFNQRIDTLEQQVAQLETGTTPAGGSTSAAIIVAAANAPQAIKARADIACDGTDDAATINRITEPVQLTTGTFLCEQPILIQRRGHTITGWDYSTVLMRAKTFTDLGRGSVPALIKVADTVEGNRAAAIQIRDLFLAGRHRANFGIGAPSGTVIGGIWLDIDAGDNNNPADGWPVGGPDNSDNWSSLTRLRVWDTTTGIHVEESNGARGFMYRDLAISRLQNGGIGLDLRASDGKASNIEVSSGGAENAIGINVNGGNTHLASSKVFFFNKAGSVGVRVASSRASLTAVEAQDNRVGIQVQSVHAKLTGCRVDNMLAGMDTGLDLSSASHLMCTGQIVQTRGSGTYSTGIALPGNTTGILDAYIDATSIDRAVSGAVPANLEARIVVRDGSSVSSLRRQV